MINVKDQIWDDVRERDILTITIGKTDLDTLIDYKLIWRLRTRMELYDIADIEYDIEFSLYEDVSA